MAERIKIYEEKKKSRGGWVWVLLLLILLAIAAFFLMRRHAEVPVVSGATRAAAAFPDPGLIHFDSGKTTGRADNRRVELLSQQQPF